MEEDEDVFQAVVLADNFDSHMFGSECPIRQECLVPLVDRTLIDYALEALCSCGVDEIILVCSKEIDQVKQHVKSGGWSCVHVVGCEGARNLGDAMRELDARGLVRGKDFLLLLPGAVTNVDLRSFLYKKHKLNMKKRAGVVCTSLRRVVGRSQRSAPSKPPPVFVADAQGRVVWFAHSSAQAKKFKFPLSKLSGCVSVYGDCGETGVWACNSAVLPLFTDNFDFATMEDFVKGILINEDLLANYVYLERVEEGYAARVLDLQSYLGISEDLVQRWAAPFGPANPPFKLSHHFVYKHANNVTVFPGAEVVGSVLCEGCVVEKDARVYKSFLGPGCVVKANAKLRNCFIHGLDCTIGTNSVLNSFFLTTPNEKIKPNTQLIKSFYSNGETIEIPSGDSKEFKNTSDSDSDTDSSEQEHVLDADMKKFSEEVFESIGRAGEDLSNVVIEINGSKYGNNVGFLDVAPVVTHAILQLDKPLKGQLQPRLVARIKNLKRFSTLINNYAKEQDAQMEILKAIEESCVDEENVPLLPKTLLTLFNLDLVDQQVFLDWHSSEQLLFPYSETIRKNAKLLEFIEWLEQSSEEDEDDDE